MPPVASSTIGGYHLSRWWLAFAALLIVALLWPFRYLASPSWKVSVVNGSGQPLRNVSVRLVYQNYSVERTSHEITATTDKNGSVEFLPQYERASALGRLFYTASSTAQGAHASFGRHAHVFAFGAFEGDAVTGQYVTDWQGQPASLESRIVARPAHP